MYSSAQKILFSVIGGFLGLGTIALIAIKGSPTNITQTDIISPTLSKTQWWVDKLPMFLMGLFPVAFVVLTYAGILSGYSFLIISILTCLILVPLVENSKKISYFVITGILFFFAGLLIWIFMYHIPLIASHYDLNVKNGAFLLDSPCQDFSLVSPQTS